jgi:hypothetical protein
MFASDDQTFESTYPRERPLNDPSRAVSSPHPLLLSSLALPVTSMRREQNDASLFQAFPQRITVVGFVGNHSFGPCFRSSRPCARHSNGVQGSFCKLYFRWRGRFKEASQRNTLAIDHHHPLRSLAPLGFSDSRAPFFAGTKLPSMKVSSQSRSPRWSSCERKALHISTQTPSSSHFFSRRQQVAGLGYLSGRSLHLAPVRATHKMPSNTKRSSALRRPPFGLRVSGGNKGSIRLHCSSVSSCVRFLIGLPPMILLHHFIRKYKYLLDLIAISATYSFETNSRKSRLWELLQVNG